MLGKLSRASLPKEARELVRYVRIHLGNLDTIMRQPSSPERGSQVAEQSNSLEYAIDMFEHFGITDKRWIRTQAKRMGVNDAP